MNFLVCYWKKSVHSLLLLSCDCKHLTPLCFKAQFTERVTYSCGMSPLPPQCFHPSSAVFVSLVLWQLDSCGVQLTFLSSQFPQGPAPPLPIPAPVWGNQTDAWSDRWWTSPRLNGIHMVHVLQIFYHSEWIDPYWESCLLPAGGVRDQVENTVPTPVPWELTLKANWIWIKDIQVFHKSLEGCLVFSNNRNTSGVDLHCPLLPHPLFAFNPKSFLWRAQIIRQRRNEK